MDTQLQDYDGGLKDLLAEALDRNTAYVEQKTNAVDRYLDASCHYVAQLRYVTEVAKVSVERWEDHVRALMDRTVPPVPLQEAIEPPEDKRGRFAELADMLTRTNP